MYAIRSYYDIPETGTSLADKWILSRLARAGNSVAEALDSYRFNDAANTIYQFVWHEFCDWYLEAIKPTLYGKEGTDRKEATLSVLWQVLHDTLILLVITSYSIHYTKLYESKAIRN